jgi:bifunctional DNase/RNase
LRSGSSGGIDSAHGEWLKGRRNALLAYLAFAWVVPGTVLAFAATADPSSESEVRKAGEDDGERVYVHRLTRCRADLYLAVNPRLGAFPLQQMQIYGVSFDMVGKQPIVLLKTVDGNRFLPIWIGHPEAAAILMKLQGASTPRPMTHDLLSDLLDNLDAKCERVSVTELRDNTFFASITVSINGSEVEIDSRPSDALALAVRVAAPIFAAEEVIEESAIEFEHEVEDTEEVVDKFKEFLDEVTPEDFAQGES